MTKDLIEKGVEYITKFGWSIFPVLGKIPPRGSRGFKDAVKSESDFRNLCAKYPECDGIALATGKPSGVFVVDVDVKGNKRGDISLQKLEEQFGALPATMKSVTPSGGFHLFFKYPEGGNVGCSVSKVAPGIDIRGDGGYVVLPPSPGYSSFVN